MLPTHVNHPNRGAFRRHGNLSHRKTIDILLSRARVTNLAVLLLASATVVSFLYNLSFYFASRPSLPQHGSVRPLSIVDTIRREADVRNLKHLIIVPGHAVWTGSDASRRLHEEDWVLESYQKGGGRINAFYQHIKRGVNLALNDETSLLVFSGGQTRLTSTFTEADSYLRLALLSSLLPPGFSRTTTENYALDSYQNLLYSITRFHEYVGNYPEYITVVGYEMKRKRFMDVHRKAVRWPKERFDYLGVDMEEETEAAMEGELKNALIPYMHDLYGCHPPLSTKRRSRNPFARFHSYHTSSPDLAALLEWCPDRGSSRVFEGPLPWDYLWRQ